MIASITAAITLSGVIGTLLLSTPPEALPCRYVRHEKTTFISLQMADEYVAEFIPEDTIAYGSIEYLINGEQFIVRDTAENWAFVKLKDNEHIYCNRPW